MKQKEKIIWSLIVSGFGILFWSGYVDNLTAKVIMTLIAVFLVVMAMNYMRN